MGGLDPECDKKPFVCKFGRVPGCFAKSFEIPYGMIGRENQQYRIFGFDCNSGGRYRRRRIASGGFEHLKRRCVDGRKLVGDEKTMLFIADYNRTRPIGDRICAQHRVLQQAVVPGDQGQELLRKLLARHWPEACAAATAKDDGFDVKGCAVHRRIAGSTAAKQREWASVACRAAPNNRALGA